MGLKKFIYQTPFAKMVKDIEAEIQHFGFLNISDQWNGVRTVYCISPYKTGTTFLASSFNKSVSQHEPMQYLSLKKLNDDFDSFFVKRMNKFNLKLECSPYFSYYIEQLSKHHVAKDLDYLCILREPSEWITSVINFYNLPSKLKQSFEYESELFWKAKVGVEVRNFHSFNPTKKKEMIDKIIDFYFNYLQNTKKLQNVHYIKLYDLESNLDKIAEIIKERPDISKRWMRKTIDKEKVFIYKNDDLDKRYERLISSFKLLSDK